MQQNVVIYLFAGTLAIAVLFIIARRLLGDRPGTVKFDVSPKGISGSFEIDTPLVKAKSREELIVPTTTQAQVQPPSQLHPQSTQQPQPQVPPPSPILSAELEQGKPKFMSDEYIVDIATRLQIDSEEGDLVHFIDRTADKSEQ